MPAELACAIADGTEVISDFCVMGDQGELFRLVASVPTAWRTLAEIACGERTLGKITPAVTPSASPSSDPLGRRLRQMS